MKQFRIYPYKMGSQSATMLAEGLRERGTRTFKVYPNRRYLPRNNHVIINWGSGALPDWYGREVSILNDPHKVLRVGNKLLGFQDLERGEVQIPRFTTNPNVAKEWGCPIVARHKLRGHSGDGAEYVESPNDLAADWTRAPLFVEYKKKKTEYRVHVFQGEVIDIQEKRKRREVENDDVNYKIRNKHTGWVYCRDGIDCPASVSSNSILAVQSCGLDFGAVDVIWNDHEQKPYILEINTAPGLEGTTLEKYVAAFTKYIEEQ